MEEKSIAQIFNLKGKSAIVTGGGNGIGEAIALRLAEAGACVVVADIDLESANRSVEKIKSHGGIAHAAKADVSSVGDVKLLVETVVNTCKRLDILVNNAGIYNMSPALKTTEDIWDKVMNVNLKGLFFLCQAAALKMINAGNGGRIVNIASINAIHATGKMAHYDASKSGVLMLTKSLALEFAHHNILVNAVMPGAIATPGTVRIAPAKESLSSSEVFYKSLGGDRRFPLRRVGTPDDIANAVLFLSGSAADYITGTSILVDGGYMLS